MHEVLEEKARLYETPEAVKPMIEGSDILLLVGITAAGKGSITEELKKTGRYHQIVSHTTRPPRSNNGVPEQDGVHYHFVDMDTAETMIDNNAFVEVKPVHGNLYGTSAAEFQLANDEGKIALADIDIKGAYEYQKLNENVTIIFLLPPDFRTWTQRLNARYRDGGLSEDERLRRCQTAIFELEEVLKRDHFHFVVNDDLEDAARIVHELAERGGTAAKDARAKKMAEVLLQDIQASVR